MTASKMEILRGEILLSSVDDILNMLNMLAAAREDEQQKQKEAVIWLYKWTLDGKHYVLTHSDGTLCIASLDNDVERLKALAKARAEGAEQERERIQRLAIFEGEMMFPCEWANGYKIRAFDLYPPVLAPTKE